MPPFQLRVEIETGRHHGDARQLDPCEPGTRHQGSAPDHDWLLARSSGAPRASLRNEGGSERLRASPIRPDDGRDGQEDRSGERLAATPGRGQRAPDRRFMEGLAQILTRTTKSFLLVALTQVDATSFYLDKFIE